MLLENLKTTYLGIVLAGGNSAIGLTIQKWGVMS